MMRTFLRIKNRQARRLPAEFRDQDLRYPEELVATFVEKFTRPGGVVLDPFAGYGTTLVVAEAMGRVPYGLEHDPRRVRYARTQLRRPEAIVQGDARRLLDYSLPPFDLAISSPPFMERGDAESPLAGGDPADTSYAAYLQGLRQVYAQARQLLRPGARVVLEVSNLKGPQGVTTLAWDVAGALSEVLRFEGEVVIGWDSYAYGYDHSYCLVFGAPEA